MAEPLVKDCKPTQGISQYTVLDAKDSTRTMIGGLRCYEDFWYFVFNTFLVTTLFYYYF